jgi:chemotaxis protein methyltransferase CheR
MLNDSGFANLATFLKSRSGLALGPDKMYLVETRLEPIVRRHGLRDLTTLADRVRAGAEPLGSEVVEAMTTNESFFFREDRAFTHLTGQVLPRLHAARPPGARLRIWSAACSTGQEPYTVAMLLADQQGPPGRDAEIIGTDISEAALTRARDGIYSQFEVQRGLPIRALTLHFRKEGSSWRIDDKLRQAVQFRPWNLLGDLSALGRFDIVFCRNVLIYFDQPTKTRVLEAIAGQMAQDGVLYLGGAETVLGLTTRLVPATDVPGTCAYQKA